MQIKDYPLINTISDNDLFLVQTQLDGAYKSIPASDLKAYFDTSGGNTSQDFTIFMSNFNNFFDAKGHAITVNGDAVISTAQSKFNGSSIYFDGNGDWLQISDSADWDFGNGLFTIEAWLRPTDENSNSGHDHVILSTAVFNNSGWQLEINSATSGGNKAFSFFIGQYQNRVYVDDPEWLDEWRYIAVKRIDETTLELWMQGNLKKTITNYSHSASNDQPLVIGRAGLAWDSTHFYKGYCGGLKISKSALDVSTIPTQAFTI